MSSLKGYVNGRGLPSLESDKCVSHRKEDPQNCRWVSLISENGKIMEEVLI